MQNITQLSLSLLWNSFYSHTVSLIHTLSLRSAFLLFLFVYFTYYFYLFHLILQDYVVCLLLLRASFTFYSFRTKINSKQWPSLLNYLRFKWNISSVLHTGLVFELHSFNSHYFWRSFFVSSTLTEAICYVCS